MITMRIDGRCCCCCCCCCGCCCCSCCLCAEFKMAGQTIFYFSVQLSVESSLFTRNAEAPYESPSCVFVPCRTFCCRSWRWLVAGWSSCWYWSGLKWRNAPRVVSSCPSEEWCPSPLFVAFPAVTVEHARQPARLRSQTCQWRSGVQSQTRIHSKSHCCLAALPILCSCAVPMPPRLEPIHRAFACSLVSKCIANDASARPVVHDRFCCAKDLMSKHAPRTERPDVMSSGVSPSLGYAYCCRFSFFCRPYCSSSSCCFLFAMK